MYFEWIFLKYAQFLNRLLYRTFKKTFESEVGCDFFEVCLVCIAAGYLISVYVWQEVRGI